MWQTALNTVLTAAVSALVAVLLVVVKAFGDAGVAYVQQKIKAVQQKIGADNYNQKLDFAKQAWNITDEYFRITPTVEKTVAAKQAYFAEQLKKLIPGLTDEELEQLRQAIAGEVNKGRDAVSAPAEAPQDKVTGSISAGDTTLQVEDGLVVDSTPSTQA